MEAESTCEVRRRGRGGGGVGELARWRRAAPAGLGPRRSWRRRGAQPQPRSGHGEAASAGGGGGGVEVGKEVGFVGGRVFVGDGDDGGGERRSELGAVNG